MVFFRTFLTLFISATIFCNVFGQTTSVVFIGTDGDWFNPANWSGGLVPDSSTDVLITGGKNVQIDPLLAAGPVEVRDITIEAGSTLTLLSGSVMTYQSMIVVDATLDARSSEMAGDSFDLSDSGGTRILPFAGIKLNPTTKDIRSIKITANTASILGLGGADPASPGHTGSGYYATIIADDAELDGTLEIQLFYGFAPVLGQTYQIITVADTLTGTFSGLSEGAVVRNLGELDLVISYVGGDGNDVVLTAVNATGRQVPALSTAGLLVFVSVLLLLGVSASRHRKA